MMSFRLCMLVVSVLAIAPPAYGQVTSQRIRGDVVAVHGKDLDVKTSAGQMVTVRMADNVRVSARSAASPDALATGAFIGGLLYDITTNYSAMWLSGVWTAMVAAGLALLIFRIRRVTSSVVVH